MKKLMFLLLILTFSSRSFAQLGIFGASTQSQQALSTSAKLDTFLGVYLLSSCMSSKSPNMMMCMLGAFMLAQGINAQNAANQAANTSAASTMVAVPAPVTVASPVAGTLIPTVPTTAVAGLKALSNAGYTVSSSGVTGPNGKPVSMPQINSASELAGYGLNHETVVNIQRTIASAQNPKN